MWWQRQIFQPPQLISTGISGVHRPADPLVLVNAAVYSSQPLPVGFTRLSPGQEPVIGYDELRSRAAAGQHKTNWWQFYLPAVEIGRNWVTVSFKFIPNLFFIYIYIF